MTREMRFWSSVLVTIDLIAVIVAWLLAYWIRFKSGWIALPAGDVVHPLRMYVTPIMFSLIVFSWTFRGHIALTVRHWFEDLQNITRGMLLGYPLLVALTYLGYRDLYSRGVLVFFLPLALVTILTVRSTARVVLNRWLGSEPVRRRVVAVCGGQRSQQILNEYLQFYPGVHLVSCLRIEEATGVSVREGAPDEVLIISPQLESTSLENILGGLESELVDIKFIPDFGSFKVLGYEIEQAGQLPLIHLRRSPLYGWGRIGKRVFDVLLSLIFLMLTAPLLTLIAVLIWITSGLPIVYSQERMGFDGKVFTMYKFRSMVRDADQNGKSCWTQLDDPRRTRLGTWLRRMSLDELPQLYNILRGDMSLVGPRPEMASLIDDFRRQIPHYFLRHKVKAGLTGWAQIHGLRGNTSLEKRIEYDLYYIEHWSLGLDFKILVLTLFRGWSNAY